MKRNLSDTEAVAVAIAGMSAMGALAVGVVSTPIIVGVVATGSAAVVAKTLYNMRGKK